MCSFQYLTPDHMDMFNPCQRFWRIITMLSLMYFCFVIVMLNHRPEYGRYLLGYLDDRLNAPVLKGHHTYDDNCEITMENFLDNFDHYYAVHLGDWFLSSFVMRDYYLLHMWSIMDEVIELSWQHILPHFRECWWDHLIHDILLSNTPAIMFGMYIIKKMGLTTYDFWHRFDENGNTKPTFYEYKTKQWIQIE